MFESLLYLFQIAGELYTWGKGRYGRLGHGDSEDQTKPKLVEALLGCRVIDVACGKQDLFLLIIHTVTKSNILSKYFETKVSFYS